MATLNAKHEFLCDLLEHNDRAVVRAIEVIYDRQTTDEKYSHSTHHSNAVGFSALDAAFGCSLGSKIKKGYFLSEKQIMAGRRMIKRYWRQLVDVADQKTPGWADPKVAA